MRPGSAPQKTGPAPTKKILQNHPARAACHALVSGRVQGIFFRASAKAQAVRCNLTGWIQNLPDGRVELLAQGKKQDVEVFIAWCRQGPPLARVDDVETAWVKPEAGLQSFELRRYIPGFFHAVKNLVSAR